VFEVSKPLLSRLLVRSGAADQAILHGEVLASPIRQAPWNLLEKGLTKGKGSLHQSLWTYPRLLRTLRRSSSYLRRRHAEVEKTTQREQIGAT
jgi:hypothetical protein